jgi:predicted nucleotidyltransferase
MVVPVDDQPKLDLAGLTAYLAGQRDVLAAYLYGSVARGQANGLSDVDVAVLFAADLDRETIAERQVSLMTELDHFCRKQARPPHGGAHASPGR